MRSSDWIIRSVVVVGAALVGLQLGCGSSNQDMRSGYNVPASEGTVKATEGDNGNTDLEIHVKHLAQPSQVASDATVYVVWIEPRNAVRQNIGALTLNDNLEGSLNTVTPHSQFMLSITPEPSGRVAQPSHQPVFTAQVDRAD
jgi:hypothetical protein